MQIRENPHKIKSKRVEYGGTVYHLYFRHPPTRDEVRAAINTVDYPYLGCRVIAGEYSKTRDFVVKVYNN